MSQENQSEPHSMPVHCMKCGCEIILTAPHPLGMTAIVRSWIDAADGLCDTCWHQREELRKAGLTSSRDD